MNRQALRRLARLRLREARVLLREGCYSGAYYLAGYAAECALKACIAKETKRSDFPDLGRARESFTHHLQTLVKVANLTATLAAACSSDAEFAENWDTVVDWSEKARYAEHDEAAARKLYRALTDRQHGVLRWIRQFW